MDREPARQSPGYIDSVVKAADIGGDPDDLRIIEVNSNPSIRFLEEVDRADLILKIWHHTFSTLGLLDV